MATVDRSLMRGFEPTGPWFVAGLPRTEHEYGPKPLLDEVEGSPDLRPASRLVFRRIGLAGLAASGSKDGWVWRAVRVPCGRVGDCPEGARQLARAGDQR